jgi:hypothetical protein
MICWLNPSKLEIYLNTPRFCFMLFCFNAPCQFTPLLNLRCLLFGFMRFGRFICISLSLFLWEYYFLFRPFWFSPTFSGTQLGRKTGTWCNVKNLLLCHNKRSVTITKTIWLMLFRGNIRLVLFSPCMFIIIISQFTNTISRQTDVTNPDTTPQLRDTDM